MYSTTLCILEYHHETTAADRHQWSDAMLHVYYIIECLHDVDT